MKIGYARVSKREQNLDLQLDALKEAGCDKIFFEKVSGAKVARKELDNAISHLREGDILIIYKLDRLARSMKHLTQLAEDFLEKGIQLKTLKDGLTMDNTAVGKLMFHVFAMLAQFERDLTIERTNAGLAASRRKGKKGGRKPGLTKEGQEKAAQILKLYDSGVFSVQEICNTVGCARATMYKYLKLERKRIKKMSSENPLKDAA